MTYNIFGPLEDQKHWRLCKRLIDELPDNITVNYHGSIPHRDIPDMLSLADMFFLPTHGENFGHTILEALLASCPPLISDHTPWDSLGDEGAGWVVPLDDTPGFAAVIDGYARTKGAERSERSRLALEYGSRVANRRIDIQRNVHLFAPDAG